MTARVADRRCLIVGGTSGLGLAAAERFLDEGARVVIAGRSPEKGTQAVAALQARGPVAFAVCVASDFTSLATTAKPLPASPARAASIVALRARRLVWLAMSLISFTTSPIFCAAFESPCMVPLVRWASATALAAISVDCATC